MGKSILLADDSATIRKVVELTFSDTGFHVESVASGREALTRLEAFHPDLVLADVVMPGPSGYEICRHVKQSAHPVPVLLLAGTFETFDQDLARECEADGCLMKPFESRTLLERVESLLADRGHEAPADSIAPEPEAPAEDEAVPTETEDEPAPGIDEGESIPIEVRVDDASEPPPAPELSPETIDAIARAVVGRLSADVIRQIAREVVPRVAEELVRQRIREIEEDS